MARTAIPQAVKIQVLTEAGYRCAVQTCRNILAIDMHHIVEVNDKGPNEPYNLLALCPTCHALYTRGTISKEAINAWKTMLVALNHAFDKESITNLLFLKKQPDVVITGDGVLKFSGIIAADLAQVYDFGQRYFGLAPLYVVRLTDKGNRIIDAWFSGNRSAVKEALGDLPQE